MKTAAILFYVFMTVVPSTLGITLHAPSHLIQQLDSTVQIDCTLSNDNTSSSPIVMAEDLVWTFDDVRVPKEKYTAVNDSTSQLTLDNVTADDAGNYSCLVQNPQIPPVAMATTIVQLGTLPDIANFSCVCHNMGDMWCTWDPVYTYLPVHYEFTWQQYYVSVWNACPDTTTKGPYSCYIRFDVNLGSLHEMRVNATNALGSTQETIWFNPDIETIPLPPENVQVIVKGSHSLLITWEQPIDWYADFFYLQYKLQYSSEWEQGNWSKEIANIKRQKTYLITGLRPFTHYTLRIAAMPATSHEDYYWSPWVYVSGRTLESAPSEGVQLFIAGETRKSDQLRDVTIMWTLPPIRHRNGIIIGFSITIHDESDPSSGNNTVIDNGNATMHTFEDLDVYKQYYVLIRAFNSAGSSRPTSCGILDKITAPSEPVHVEAKALSQSSIRVSWNPPLNPKAALTEYIIVYQNAEHYKEWNWISVPSSENSYTIDNLEAFVQYEFKVQAKNVIGFGGFSPTVFQYTLEGVPTGPPTNLTIRPVVRDPTSLLLVWKAPHLEVRNGLIVMYTVVFCPYRFTNRSVGTTAQAPTCKEDNKREVNVTVTKPLSTYLTQTEQRYVIRGLKANTRYAVAVSPYTSKGQGPYSEFVTHKTAIGMPEKSPDNLAVSSSSITDSAMMVKWSPLSDVINNSVHYELGIKAMNSTHCGVQILKTNSTVMAVNHLCGYEMYEVVVRACSNADIEVPCGKFSEPMYVKTDIGVPTAPQEVDAETKGESTVKVTWSQPKRPNGPVSELTYSIMCYNEGEAMSTEMITSELEVMIEVECDGSLGAESVNAMCTVTPVSALQVKGQMAYTDQILVCYEDPVWPYIVAPFIVVLVLIIIMLGSKMWYKHIKKKGFFDTVSHATPFWEQELKYQDTPVYTDILIGENYDKIASDNGGDGQTEETAISTDTISMHSSDHGVDVDSGRFLLQSQSDRQTPSGGNSRENSEAGENDARSDEESSTGQMRVKRLSSSIEDYQQVGENSGELILHPEVEKTKSLESHKEYSALSQKDDDAFLQPNSQSGTPVKGKKNFGVGQKFDIIGDIAPSADHTNISVCHAAIAQSSPETILKENIKNESQSKGPLAGSDDVISANDEKEAALKKKMEREKNEAVWKKRGQAVADHGSSIGDYSTVGNEHSQTDVAKDTKISPKKLPPVSNEEYQPFDFISGPVNNCAKPAENALTPDPVNSDPVNSDPVCEGSDSEDGGNTVPLLHSSSSQGQQKSGDSPGVRRVPYHPNNPTGDSNGGVTEEENKCMEAEPLVSPSVMLDGGYVPNDDVTMQGICRTADLRQTRV